MCAGVCVERRRKCDACDAATLILKETKEGLIRTNDRIAKIPIPICFWRLDTGSMESLDTLSKDPEIGGCLRHLGVCPS